MSFSETDPYDWSVTALAAQKESTGNSLEFSGSRSGPYFDKAASKNVTALLGKTTYLNCRVKNLGNKTVSTVSEFIQYTYSATRGAVMMKITCTDRVQNEVLYREFHFIRRTVVENVCEKSLLRLGGILLKITNSKKLIHCFNNIYFRTK